MAFLYTSKLLNSFIFRSNSAVMKLASVFWFSQDAAYMEAMVTDFLAPDSVLPKEGRLSICRLTRSTAGDENGYSPCRIHSSVLLAGRDCAEKYSYTKINGVYSHRNKFRLFSTIGQELLK